MKKLFVCACAAALAAMNLAAEEAEGEQSDAKADQEAAGEAAEIADAAGAKKQDEVQEKFYRTLPLCRHLEGTGDVLYPGQSEWQPITEGKFYPLGCTYRTTAPNTKLIIEFGKECLVKINGLASFGTRLQGLDVKSRSISLVSGEFALSLPRNLPEAMFSIAAPGFVVTNANGESTFKYEKTGDGDEATIRCVTGTLAMRGLHFEIPGMHAADEIKIRTSQDLLFTGLYGTSGDYELRLDQGMVSIKDVETGVSHVEPKTLVWKLSPCTCARIHRARPAIGSRMSVTAMTFEPSGKLVNRCTFSEGRYELNTGEQGEIALKRIEEESKRAAAAAEAQGATTVAPAEEPKAEEPKDEEPSE